MPRMRRSPARKPMTTHSLNSSALLHMLASIRERRQGNAESRSRGSLKTDPRTIPIGVDELYPRGSKNTRNRRHGPLVRLDFVISNLRTVKVVMPALATSFGRGHPNAARAALHCWGVSRLTMPVSGVTPAMSFRYLTLRATHYCDLSQWQRKQWRLFFRMIASAVLARIVWFTATQSTRSSTSSNFNGEAKRRMEGGVGQRGQRS